MTSKLKTDVLETVSGSGTIALTNQLSGMTSASVPLLTETQMPVGSVLQVIQTHTPSASGNTTSTSFIATGVTAAITPKFNNSLILISFSVSMSYISSGYGNMQMHIDDGGGGYSLMTGGSHYHIGYVSPTANYNPQVFNGYWTASSLNTLTFQPYAASPTGSNFTYFHSSSSLALTLTEIKQ